MKDVVASWAGIPRVILDWTTPIFDVADCVDDPGAISCAAAGAAFLPGVGKLLGEGGKKVLEASEVVAEDTIKADNVPAVKLHSDRVKGAESATIDSRKLTEYALNPDHPVGGNKARVFESALGFNLSNADDLMNQLKRGVLENPAVAGKADQYGSRCTVEIPVVGPKGNGRVVTGWMVPANGGPTTSNTLFVK
ncbi:hypothetical protein V5P93_003004 [Actinokineospora auranticolor]|uniref:DUF6883 domain-containing protein n=1 Tax=Actinokineospora auranticolor TaxID=155976 RepID=A0A2S6H130_9PSEU|nr:DUF6883 domain-containing protein [Actinokineospora auranticolor]PPK71141.1 hypothetical protein CLV40_101330 [Actinokineospora auranticolor]